jgi:hypothetical protein
VGTTGEANCHPKLTRCIGVRLTFDTLITRLFQDNVRPSLNARRQGNATAHAICPSKPRDVAIAR